MKMFGTVGRVLRIAHAATLPTRPTPTIFLAHDLPHKCHDLVHKHIIAVLGRALSVPVHNAAALGLCHLGIGHPIPHRGMPEDPVQRVLIGLIGLIER